jgi:hypothetical protein
MPAPVKQPAPMLAPVKQPAPQPRPEQKYVASSPPQQPPPPQASNPLEDATVELLKKQTEKIKR